jgi:hypothetical protein
MTVLVAFVAGIVFALGLGLGGMTRPDKVLAFLDVTGAWDPSLAFVMAGAVTTSAVLHRVIVRRVRPVLESTFAIPTRTDVDARLVGGAVLFGIGWGLVGFCPGPAIVGLGGAMPQAAVFVGAMLGGMLLYEWGMR